LSANDFNGPTDVSTPVSRNGRGWVWFILIFAVLTALSRFLFLAEKPFHHDESLHAYYSNRVAQGNPHEYSALLHGPVLYYVVGFFMKIFGAGDFTARFPAALCNLLLVLLPLLWRKRLGLPATLAMSVFVALSPTFMYFGRFLREDAFNTLWIAGSLAGFFGYRWTGRPWMAVSGSAFLAMQFCNKENSYLHVFIWLTGALVIFLLSHRQDAEKDSWRSVVRRTERPATEKIALWVNCSMVFAFIYVLFYSSFFKHPKGAMHGILDGLYRESLLYWWEQNQKRRIDGPFDYYSPLFFNYEFALVPALLCAWYRNVRLAALTLAARTVSFPFSLLSSSKRVVLLGLASLVGVLFLPRVGLTPDGCSISEMCLRDFAPEALSGLLQSTAKVLHLVHSRHVLQIVATALLGAISVLAAVRLGQKLDAFLWWWATGAIGVYSYVGEKVPWLHVYLLLPLIAIAGLEVGRVFDSSRLWIDSLSEPRSLEIRRALAHWDIEWRRRFGRSFLTLSCFLLVFAGWKAIRLSFFAPANPQERLVFTQTTPQFQSVRQRWLSLASDSGQRPKITLSGDATWPGAWFVRDFSGHDFVKPADAQAAARFDAVFLDVTQQDFARQEFTGFDIYKIPLRHWWVPQPNPRISEIIDYFLTSRPYPRELRSTPQELGIGNTSILYLENRMAGRFFEKAPLFEGVELIGAAVGTHSLDPADGTKR